jgi:hypothetical protein
MMNTTRTWTSILAAVAALGVAGSALAQPHRDDHRDDRRDDHRNDRDRRAPPPGVPVAVAPAAGTVAEAPPAGGVAVAPPADPALRARLHQFEEQRQRDRKLAVKDPKVWNDGRPQRAVQRRSEIASTWGSAVNSPEAQAELKTHADRMARLDRILDIANQKSDTALAARAQTDIQTEVDRDARVMQIIRDKAGVR